MEYTDAPTPESPAVIAGGITCPHCGRGLEENAKTCHACGWVHPEAETAEGKASDYVAVYLSVIPGLGHVYKGHKWLGLLFVIGAFGAIFLGLLASTATAAFGLFLIPIYWLAVMFHAYAIKDCVVPVTKDEGEEY